MIVISSVSDSTVVRAIDPAARVDLIKILLFAIPLLSIAAASLWLLLRGLEQVKGRSD